MNEVEGQAGVQIPQSGVFIAFEQHPIMWRLHTSSVLKYCTVLHFMVIGLSLESDQSGHSTYMFFTLQYCMGHES